MTAAKPRAGWGRHGMTQAATDIRAWRARLGLTQAAAAEAVGVTSRLLRYYESGRRGAPLTVRLAMRAVELGLDPVGGPAQGPAGA